MALSPWPDTPAALKTATATLRAALDRRANSSDPFAYDDVDAAVQRLGSTAAALVERYAPDAPPPIKNEAVIRFARLSRRSQLWGAALGEDWRH